jgi:hypothetical protein
MRIFAVFTLVMVAACGGTADDEVQVTPATFTNVQSMVFSVGCNVPTCHGMRGGLGGLILDSGMSYDELINVDADNAAAQAMGLKLVVPGDPSASFLMTKLRSPLDPQFGTVMPQGTQGLDAPRLDLVERWIRAGAPND